MRRQLLNQLSGLLLLGLLLPATVATAAPASEPALPKFSKATLDAIGRIPVQHGGRVKPLSTFATYSLLHIRHRKGFTDGDGKRMSSTEWFLRASLFPRTAMRDRVFRIEDSDVLDAIGLKDLKELKRKTDYYSYQELSPGMRQLRQKFREYVQVDRNDQTRAQKQVIALGSSVNIYESIQRLFVFADFGVPLRGEEQSGQFGGREFAPLTEVLKKLRATFQAGEDPEWAQPLAQAALTVAYESRGLRLAAPISADDGYLADWFTVDVMVDRALGDQPDADANMAYIEKLEALHAARGNAGALEKASIALYEEARARAESSKAYGKIDLEVTYQGLKAFFWSKWIFLLGFFVMCFALLFPKLNKPLVRTAWGLAIFGTVLSIYGIVLRCVLLGRPPVTTLYETLLFVTGVACLTGLAIEWMNRRRVGLFLVLSFGALGMFLSDGFELLEQQDTMRPLVAVLDTNFWLATHVTTITAGYAAGLLAAAFGHVYLFSYILRIRRNDKEYYRGIQRMLYGTLAFSLIFTVVGTILGGVWANESWGRFWGWDPKENGALMIVLSQLAIIHGRLGGYLKGFGLSIASIASAIIIAFSWWGTNLMGVGLHAYGFTAGLDTALKTFYAVEIFTMLVAGLVWFYDFKFASKPSLEESVTA